MTTAGLDYDVQVRMFYNEAVTRPKIWLFKGLRAFEQLFFALKGRCDFFTLNVCGVGFFYLKGFF